MPTFGARTEFGNSLDPQNPKEFELLSITSNPAFGCGSRWWMCDGFAWLATSKVFVEGQHDMLFPTICANYDPVDCPGNGSESDCRFDVEIHDILEVIEITPTCVAGYVKFDPPPGFGLPSEGYFLAPRCDGALPPFDPGGGTSTGTGTGTSTSG